jgi:hypothetical protein
LNALAAFIHPCQLIVAKQLPTRGAWAHDLKHDGYRLHVHVREGAVLFHFDAMLFVMIAPSAFKNQQLAPFLSVRQNIRYQH